MNFFIYILYKQEKMLCLNSLQRAIQFSKTLHEVLKELGFKPCQHEETYFSFRIPIRIPDRNSSGSICFFIFLQNL